jgi:hypothetical protein
MGLTLSTTKALRGLTTSPSSTSPSPPFPPSGLYCNTSPPPLVSFLSGFH